MRIGIDARFYGGEQSKGLGRYTQKLIEHVLRLDQQNEYVIFVQDESAQQVIQQLGKNTCLAGRQAEVILAPYRWYTLAEQIFLPRLITRAKIDLMHFPHFNVPLFYNKPYVVTIHDLIISRFPTERATTLGPLMYRFKQWAYNRVIAHAAYHAKKIITVSEYSKQDIMDYFTLPADRIIVTYEAVEPFAEAVATTTALVTSPYLLYVGNAYPHKNLEVLLQVMQQLKQDQQLNFKLMFVGKTDYFYKRLQDQAIALQVDDVVVFTGFVPDTDLPLLYRRALAYIFPSKYEGFGLPPLEAMSYGTPVLAARSSCLPEILGEAALYFDFQDVSGIIKQIFVVQENQELRQQLVQGGYEQVQHYHWETLAQQTLQIYESVFTKS